MTQRAIKKLHTMGEEKEVISNEEGLNSVGLFPVNKFMALPDGVKHKASAPGSSDTSYHLATLPRRGQHLTQAGPQPVRAIHSLQKDVVYSTPGNSLTVLHGSPRPAVYVTHSPRDNIKTVYGTLQWEGQKRHKANTEINSGGVKTVRSHSRTEAWLEGGSTGPRYQKRAQSTPPQVKRVTDNTVNGAIPGQHSSKHVTGYSSLNGKLPVHGVYDSHRTSVTSEGFVVTRGGQPAVWSSSIERIPVAGEAGSERPVATFTSASQYNTLPVHTKQNSASLGDIRSTKLNTKDTGNVIILRPKKEFIMMGNYYDPQELYGTHSRTSNLLKSKAKFSSMPSLFGSKDLDKKALKREKKRIKEEEKRLKKEEKKRKKLEKKYATVNPNMMMSRNWNYVQKPIEDVYMRPKLQLRAVPIDFEDGPSRRAPTVPPPPPPDIGLRHKYLHSSAPDLLRLEQVYGSLSRRPNTNVIYRQRNRRKAHTVVICRKQRR